MPTITLVAAVAQNGVIGRDNGLVWRLRSDLKRFKALTMGKPILMGRKTFASLGRPLPGRHNIVLTRDPGFRAPDITLVHAWDEALAAAGPAEELMVVGGAEIYALALAGADRIHLTEVEGRPEGDTYFPAFDRAAFREVAREAHNPSEHDERAFSFVELVRAH
ncbi:dihydrofolate reductase [Methylobacterium planeticum]|uniref:Dihydrofolate reductase n=1 Tax=Methylobacterium planeticum TaxID=2615211 RepID=A0A6N6MSK0_9HYPH|nr:dihydrofolate reductase [Methylobacterium planeticum]KAB1073898.1 dihydrofolate reductase [Methylobacterium planeticum]